MHSTSSFLLLVENDKKMTIYSIYMYMYMYDQTYSKGLEEKKWRKA